MGFGGGIGGGAGGEGGGGYDSGNSGGFSDTVASGYGSSSAGPVMDMISGILGPAYSTGTNYAYEITPTGLSRIGTPSLAGGMMGTAAGQRSPGYSQAHYQNLQAQIVRNAAARRATENAVSRQIEARSKANPHEYARDLGLLSQGKLGDLAAKGYDVSGMRGTHTGGGLLGSLFGSDEDAKDVETMSENAANISELATIDPVTGQVTTVGYGPMSPGFGVSMMAPGIAQKAAEYAYGATQSPAAAMAAGNAVGMGTSAIGKSMQPSGFSGLAGQALTGLAGLAGVPGMTQLGQMAGAMQNAANLNYAGITAPSKTAIESYGPNDQNYLFQRGLLA